MLFFSVFLSLSLVTKDKWIYVFICLFLSTAQILLKLSKYTFTTGSLLELTQFKIAATAMLFYQTKTYP